VGHPNSPVCREFGDIEPVQKSRSGDPGTLIESDPISLVKIDLIKSDSALSLVLLRVWFRYLAISPAAFAILRDLTWTSLLSAST